MGFDTATGGKGLGKGKGREHEGGVCSCNPSVFFYSPSLGLIVTTESGSVVDTASSPDHHDDGWQVVKPKQGNRDWGALRGGRTAGGKRQHQRYQVGASVSSADEEDGKPLPPWRRVAAHHPGAARRGGSRSG